MSKRKKVGLVTLVLALLLAALVPVTIWLNNIYVFVGLRAFPRDALFLNLHGLGITVRQYETLREALPDCRLYWEVPFQGNYYPDSARSVSLDGRLSKADLEALEYLPKLETIDARSSQDYDTLLILQQSYPQYEVLYDVTIDGQVYHQDTVVATVEHLTKEDLAQFAYLPKMKTVNAWECRDYAMLAELQEQHPEYYVNYNIEIAGKDYSVSSVELELERVSAEDVEAVVAFMPRLRSIHVVNPSGALEDLIQLKRHHPKLDISWEIELLGVRVRSDAVEADFSGTTLESIEQVEEAMAYLPDVKIVFLDDCGLDNEVLADFRERKREEYKVVWTVDCGGIPVRTDATTFMPVRENVYYFHDEDAYNLRYCEEMVCIDIGHMSIHNLDFVTYMPHLTYLVLAHTMITDITPLSTCDELLFLELDWTAVRDYTPLLGCTSLEDLNLGLTYGDETVIGQMTWLEHLWWKGRGYTAQQYLTEALPDTVLNFNSKHTVGGGWRQLQNYYDMRDLLGMEYMIG